MAAKPKRSASARNARKKPLEHFRARIRMYRQGLGDCFLLTFPASAGDYVHVMIDCGVVLGTGEPAAVMKEVANDIAEATNHKVDLLVITHEHWDHVSAFTPAQAQAELGRIEFSQAWMAWTEDPTNDLANALRAERELKRRAAVETKKRLEEAKSKGGQRGEEAGRRAARLGAVLEFTGAAGEGEEGDGGTKGALDFIKEHVKELRTLRPGEAPIAIPGLDPAEVRVYVLGPPEVRKRLRKADPGAEGFHFADGMSLADSYWAAFDLKTSESAQPFAKSFRRPLPMLDAADYMSAANEWRKVDDEWLGVGERLALQLDSATNNTSLVLAFEFVKSGDVLLFVGDAQAGNWLSWDEVLWTVNDAGKAPRQVSAAELLNHTIFYKVGHHGSHNATLDEKGLQRMTDKRLAAVIPVDVDVAHHVKGWKRMPLPALTDALKKKCSILFQSDAPPVSSGVDESKWTASDKTFDVCRKDPKTKEMKTVRKENLYYDYFV